MYLSSVPCKVLNKQSVNRSILTDKLQCVALLWLTINYGVNKNIEVINNVLRKK
jgi:hypothetical protein